MIALKVSSKIRARERFAVYVIIPIWPEVPLRVNPFRTHYIGFEKQ